MTELQRQLGPTRKQWVLLAFLIGALIGLGVLARMGGGAPDNINWRYDFQTAKADAQASGKPILLYFTADWCGPCQKMKQRVWPDDRLADAVNTSVVPLYLDVDKPEVKELAGKYHLRSFPIPLFIVTSPDGRPLTDGQRPLTHDGYATVDLLTALVESADSARPIEPTGDDEAG